MKTTYQCNKVVSDDSSLLINFLLVTSHTSICPVRFPKPPSNKSAKKVKEMLYVYAFCNLQC